MMTLKSILKNTIAAASTTFTFTTTGNAKRRRIEVSASATASAINLAVKRRVRFDLPQALPKAQGEWILIGVFDSDGFMDLDILSDVHEKFVEDAFYSTFH